MKSRVDKLITSAKADSFKLEQLSSRVDHLRGGVAVSLLSPTAQAQLQSLLGISEHANNLIVQQRILANLSFDGMHRRYEDVPEAHSKTFQWIFEHESEHEPLVSSDDGSNKVASSNAESYDETVAAPSGTPQGVDNSPDPAVGAMVPNYYINGADKMRSHLGGKVDERKAAAKEALLTWLLSGDGIFHISGKLGSGKS